MFEHIWNILSKKTKLAISINAYKNADNSLTSFAQTSAMLHWSELNKKEKNILEKYTKGK